MVLTADTVSILSMVDHPVEPCNQGARAGGALSLTALFSRGIVAVMRVQLTPTVPAFRIDDLVLERLWRLLEERCALEDDGTSRLSVTDRVSVPGQRGTEERTHEYRTVADLRRGSRDERVLRRYRLTVSSSWRNDSREVLFFAPGGGPVSLEVSGPDPGWCHAVVDAVFALLRPHGVWYGAVHRGGLWAPLAVLGGVLLALLVSHGVTLTLGGPWFWHGVVVGASILVTLVVALRDRLFPAADIRVIPRVGGVQVPSGRVSDPPAREQRVSGLWSRVRQAGRGGSAAHRNAGGEAGRCRGLRGLCPAEGFGRRIVTFSRMAPA